MTQQLTGVLVIIASPGDTSEERAVVREQINDWNINRGRRMGVVLLPWLYERSAVPKLGGRPQAIINAQAVDRADVEVAFFDSRLGSSTGVDVSGTAEEIRRAHESGKPVHVYLSSESLPRDVDLKQQAALREFQEDLRRQGLLGDCSDPADLAGQVIDAIEHDIDEAGWSDSVQSRPTQGSGALLKWRHEQEKEQEGFDARGKMKYRLTRNRLVVENPGDRAAEDVRFTVVGLGGAELHFESPEEPFTLEVDSTREGTAIPLRSGTIQIDATWTEAGELKAQTRTVSV